MIETGTHTQTGKDGSQKKVKCEYLKCKNTSGKCKSQSHVFKVIASGTHKVRQHLKACNPARYLELCPGAPPSSLTPSDPRIPLLGSNSAP